MTFEILTFIFKIILWLPSVLALSLFLLLCWRAFIKPLSYRRAKEKGELRHPVAVAFQQTQIRSLGEPLARFGASPKKILVVTAIIAGSMLFFAFAIPDSSDEVFVKYCMFFILPLFLPLAYIVQGRHITVYQHGFVYGTSLFSSRTIYHSDIDQMVPKFILARDVNMDGSLTGPTIFHRTDYELFMRDGSKIYLKSSGYPEINEMAYWLGVDWNPAVREFRYIPAPPRVQF